VINYKYKAESTQIAKLKLKSVCVFNNILDSPICDGKVNFLFTILSTFNIDHKTINIPLFTSTFKLQLGYSVILNVLYLDFTHICMHIKLM